jgi:hypothetical protein
MTEPFGLVGARVEDVGAEVPDDSIIVQCYECRRDMWLAPSSQKVMARASRILCTQCWAFEVRAKPEMPRTVARLPGALAEYEEYKRKQRRGRL